MKNDEMKIYTIEVRPLVDFEKLDLDDQEFFGPVPESGFYLHGAVAESEDLALDVFHSTVPIAVLEDFDIRIQEVKK